MRIAIVNDLSLAREVLRRQVLSVPGYTVAWCAEDGVAAVSKAAVDRPDAILMDLVMPRLDGVEATRQIMRQSPCPVLVVTSTVSGNFDLVIRAMGAGALDAVETPVMGPGGTIAHGEKLVARLAKLEALGEASGSGVMAPFRAGPAPTDLPPLVLLGASTGGPEALSVVLASLPPAFPAAVLITQHIDAAFAPGLIQQFAARTRLTVRLAKDGDRPTAGVILVAGSDDHMEVTPDCSIRYTPVPRTYPYRPSVDVLFTSAGGCWPRLGVAAQLTGMGPDGAEGLLRLRAGGWHTIAQDPATCVVDTMPKTAIEKGAAAEVLPLAHVGPSIVAKILTGSKR